MKVIFHTWLNFKFALLVFTILTMIFIISINHVILHFLLSTYNLYARCLRIPSLVDYRVCPTLSRSFTSSTVVLDSTAWRSFSPTLRDQSVLTFNSQLIPWTAKLLQSEKFKRNLFLDILISFNQKILNQLFTIFITLLRVKKRICTTKCYLH